jgi:hypothetical protein
MAVKEINKKSASKKRGEPKTGPLSADFLKSIPKHPGVFLIKNSNGPIN